MLTTLVDTIGSYKSKLAIVSIYDIFGITPPTLLGADYLSQLPPQPLIIMPDLFKGEPMLLSNYPPNTPEKQKLISEFFAGPANPANTVEVVKQYLQAAQERYPEITEWVIVGFCWGGKIAALLSKGQPQKGIVASVQVHPAFLDTADAAEIKIPHLVLASKDEDANVVKEYKEAFQKYAGADQNVAKSEVHTFEDMHHGWMGARAKLDEVEYKEKFNQGYKLVAEWINKHFSSTIHMSA
jgi:dienelactone hydrolase